MTKRTIKLIREGKCVAEVSIAWIEEDDGWSPYLTIDQALKLDAFREALRRGDVSTAARHAQVFELLPVSG